jgi:hypothetical protein
VGRTAGMGPVATATAGVDVACRADPTAARQPAPVLRL